MDRLPLCLGELSSLSNSTQEPAITKVTTLVYTGIDLFATSRMPPSMGAIIPPLMDPVSRAIIQLISTTYIRDNAEAAPHAVPRTFVPKISGVHLNNALNNRLQEQRFADLPIQHSPHGLRWRNMRKDTVDEVITYRGAQTDSNRGETNGP